MNATTTLLTVVGALLGMAALWTAVLWALSVSSGWRELARRHPAHGATSGERFAWTSASFGRGLLPVNFNGVLTIHVAADGLSVRCHMPAFGAFAPFRLPWSAIESVEARAGLLGKRSRVAIKDWRGWIDVRGAAGEALLAAWVALRAPAGAASRATGPARDDRRPLLLVGAALAIVILAALALALGTSPR
jgi:hypothetical protein